MKLFTRREVIQRQHAQWKRWLAKEIATTEPVRTVLVGPGPDAVPGVRCEIKYADVKPMSEDDVAALRAKRLLAWEQERAANIAKWDRLVALNPNTVTVDAIATIDTDEAERIAAMSECDECGQSVETLVMVEHKDLDGEDDDLVFCRDCLAKGEEMIAIAEEYSR